MGGRRRGLAKAQEAGRFQESGSMMSRMIKRAGARPDETGRRFGRTGDGPEEPDSPSGFARLNHRSGEFCQERRRCRLRLAEDTQRIGSPFDGMDAFIFMRRDVSDGAPGAPGIRIGRDRAPERVQRAGHVAGGTQAETTAVERSGMRRMRLQHALKGSEGRFGVPCAQERGCQGRLNRRVA